MQIPNTSAVRVAWVSSPKDYTASDGSVILAMECDILSCISTEGRVHHAHTGTGAINLACAAKIPDTIPFQIVQKTLENTNGNAPINIGHPSGVMQVNATVIKNNSGNWIAQ